MTLATRLFLTTFVALIVALSMKTLVGEFTQSSLHAAIAGGEILAAVLLLPKRSAPVAGTVLAAICLGVALLHLAGANQLRFDLLIYASVALYLGLMPRTNEVARTA
jgi:hypothetical protein